MQAAQRKATNLYLQHPPPLPPNPKAQPNLLSPREPYLTRTNSNSKSFKKTSTEKSTKQKEIQQDLRYALPNKIQSSMEKSTVRSENNIGELLVQTHLDDNSAIIYRTKANSKSKKDDKDYTADKGNSTKPFDVLSGASGSNQARNKDKNDDYYLYWKTKAHEYLESNMKMMEDIRKLTRQNEELKLRVQTLESNAQSVIKKEMNSSEIAKQLIKKEQNRSNAYLVQKMEEMQRELKKKEIVIKSYQEKIRELNSRIVADSERTRLINRLKTQIDDLKAQLNGQIPTKKTYLSTQYTSIEDNFRSLGGRGQFKGKNYDRG